MDENKRQIIVAKIKYYSEKVNGFKARKVNLDYWNSLEEYTLMRVYKKWQDLYAVSVFTDLPNQSE